MHLAPGRQPHQHLITQVLQAWYSSWCPTNSVKALKAKRLHKYNSPSSFHLLHGRRCGRWPTVRPAATRAAGTQAYPSPACSCPSRTAASPGWSYAAEPGPSAPAYIKQVATVIVEKACMFQQSMKGGQQICRNDVRVVGCWQVARDQPNSRFHGHEIFCEIRILPWKTLISLKSVISVNFNALLSFMMVSEFYQQHLSWTVTLDCLDSWLSIYTCSKYSLFRTKGR